jgi:ferredoxin-like protein FixX
MIGFVSNHRRMAFGAADDHHDDGGDDRLHCARAHARQSWFGKCWYIYNMHKYEFRLEFDVRGCMESAAETCAVLTDAVQIPITYPATAPELTLPELDGKTAKMYRFV